MTPSRCWADPRQSVDWEPWASSVLSCCSAPVSRHVFGIDPDPDRLAVAERSGVIPVPADCPDPAAFIKAAVPGVDVGIEASGRYAGLASLLRCVAPMGRLVVISSYGNQSEGIVLGHEFHRNRISLISSMTVNGCAHPKAPLWTFERLTGEAGGPAHREQPRRR